jgi:hypothetical protein
MNTTNTWKYAFSRKMVHARVHALTSTFAFGNGARRSIPEEVSGTSIRPRAAGSGPREEPVEQSQTATPLEPQKEPLPHAMTGRALRT